MYAIRSYYAPTYFPVNPNDFPADKIIKDISELKSGTLSGLGAYKLTSFKRDEEAIFEANPAFYGDKPDVSRIVIRYFADATTMRLAFEKGEIDLVYKSLNPSDIKDLSAKGEFTTNRLSGPQIRYICFETSESLFKDKVLRQAIAALVNRPDIIQKVYLGQNSPLYSMVPNGMMYQTENFKTVFGDANVELATKLLASKGYTADKPLTFDFWYTPSHYGDTEVNMAEVLKANFDACPAVKVTLKSAEWATYKDNWNKKLMPAYLLGWYPDYVDPDNYTAAFAGTSGSAGMGIYFSDPEWDALFAKEQGSTDPAVRKQVFEKVQAMWADEVMTVPIWQGDLFIFRITSYNVCYTKLLRQVSYSPSILYEAPTRSIIGATPSISSCIASHWLKESSSFRNDTRSFPWTENESARMGESDGTTRRWPLCRAMNWSRFCRAKSLLKEMRKTKAAAHSAMSAKSRRPRFRWRKRPRTISFAYIVIPWVMIWLF